MKKYYITWDEHKNRSCYRYCSWIMAENRQEAREIYFAEQDRRRFYDLPHMFHAKIALSLDLGDRKFKTIEDCRGSLYR